MKILVCFKAVPNWEKILDADWEDFSPSSDLRYAGVSFNCFDESALELALRLKAQDKERAGESFVAAVTVGKTLSAHLAESLYAAGFDEVTLMSDSGAEFDPRRVAARLWAYAREREFDLVLTGIRAGMADSALVPGMLAQKLGIQHIQDVQEISLTPAGVLAVQLDEDGLWQREYSLPALVSVGNSPAVLRAVNLRTRMSVKGKAPTVIEEDIPSNAQEPQLSRVKIARNAVMLEAAGITELAQGLLRELSEDRDEAPSSAGDGITLPEDIYTVCCDDKSSIERLSVVLDAVTPDLVIIDDTSRGRDLALAISQRSGAALQSGAKILSVEKGGVRISKRVCASNLEWTRVLPFPAVLTVYGSLPEGAITIAEQRSAASLANRTHIPEISLSPISGSALSETLLAPPTENSLSNKDCVVVCGAGMGSRENCEKARTLAEKLGAGFGLTRSAALCGWGGADEIVGMSGSRIAPKTALVFGASGAGAFLAGIEDVGKICAVNTDPKALIFRSADAGAVADAPSLVEAMLELL